MLVLAILLSTLFLYVVFSDISIEIKLLSYSFIIAFSEGLWSNFGFGVFIPRLIVSFLIVFTIFYLIIKRKSYFFLLKRHYYIIIFILLSVISAIFNKNPFSDFILFLSLSLIGFVFFRIGEIIALGVKTKDITILFKLIKILLLIQILAAIIKSVTIGQKEDYTGTLSVSEGSLGTILPLFGISVFIVTYLFDKKILNILITCAFIFLGLVNDKRVLLYAIPILVFLAYILDLFFKKAILKISESVIPKLLLFGLIIAIFIAITPRVLPSLNPENKIWGSWDMDYIIFYTSEYNRTKKGGNITRKDAPKHFLELLKSKSIENFFLGNGPGDVIDNRFASNYSADVYSKYGVRYGGRTTFIWFLLQVGILGVFTFLMFYLKQTLFVFKKSIRRKSIYDIYLPIILVLILFIFLVDFFTYSNSFFNSQALFGLFNFMLGMQVSNFNTSQLFYKIVSN